VDNPATSVELSTFYYPEVFLIVILTKKYLNVEKVKFVDNLK